MASSPSSVRPRTILILAGALAGAAVAVYNYLTPLTGVTGSLGALIVIASSILLIIAGVLPRDLQGGGGKKGDCDPEIGGFALCAEKTAGEHDRGGRHQGGGQGGHEV